ncbi:DNA translocase FtsK [Lacticaseibacillus suihuaensis]
MPHYDGPAFNREPQKIEPAYPLPKRMQREPKPHQAKPATASEPAGTAGRHSIDPLAALIAVPKSHHRTKRPAIDYAAIVTALRPSEADLFLIETGAADATIPAAPAAGEAAARVDALASGGAASNTGSTAPSASAAAGQAAVTTRPTTVVVGEAAPTAPAVETSAAETPAVETPAAATSAAETPVTATSAAATSAVETSAAETSAAEAPAAETPVTATVTELLAAGQPLPTDPELKSQQRERPLQRPSKLPNPYAVRNSVRDYLKAKKAAKKGQAAAGPARERPAGSPAFQPLTSPVGTPVQAQTPVSDHPQTPPTITAAGRPAATGEETSADVATLPPSAAAVTSREPAPANPQSDLPAQPQLEPHPAAESSTTLAAQSPQPTPAQPQAASAGEAAAQAPYQMPPLSLLADPVVEDHAALEGWVTAKAAQLDETLTAFHVEAHTVAHTVGPTVTQFQVALEPGVKVNKITNLTDDLKLALAAKDIRIEAPIPGKSTVGIEIPNLHPRPVMLKEVLNSPQFQDAASPLTVALGVDLFGQPQVTTLDKMPHGLIAGATGSGKSVFINSLLTSLLYKATPQQVRLLLIDPKAVELAVYNGLPHLVSPVVSDPKAASAALKWAVDEMEERYQKLAAAGARNLKQFNDMAVAHGDFGLVLPHIVIIVDELADLMMVAASEFQDYIARITAKARAAGIHLIVATQRPSVDVITGTIKNNIPTRIAFMVASQVDSRTIIDHNGAERLLGKGDMLYLGNGASQPIRLQGTFVDREIEAVVDFVKQQRAPQYLFLPDKLVAHANAVEAQDALFPEVLKYLVGEKNVSTSKLQRVFSIGYNRAANLIDELEMRHYISPANGSKPRDVYFNKEDLPDPID